MYKYTSVHLYRSHGSIPCTRDTVKQQNDLSSISIAMDTHVDYMYIVIDLTAQTEIHLISKHTCVCNYVPFAGCFYS